MPFYDFLHLLSLLSEICQEFLYYFFVKHYQVQTPQSVINISPITITQADQGK